ncbi:MAG: DUF460 domain-containing protein, partial [Methanomicrobiales archaeon HGW-Methanomicrobiales-4]
ARKIHGNVLTYAREIEDALQSSSLDFWKKEFKAFGGVSRVVFHVREKREQVPIPSSRGGDVQVRISGKRLDRIQYRPLSTRPPYLIVGIDPGTTVGIAAFNLNGELIKVHSSRQMRMGDVIELLYSLGKPIIIASDVSPMPFSVEKIRRAFQATPYIPRQDISVETKYALAGQYTYRNDHERDALTAAIEASRFWKHKFTNILKRIPAGIDTEEVRAGLIRGQSLEQILKTLQGSRKKEEEKRPEVTIENSDERVRVLDGLVKDLRGIVAELQKDLEKIRTENQKQKREINSLRAARAEKIRIEPDIVRRDLIIENLKKRLRLEEKNNKKLHKRLKGIKEAEKGGSEEYLQIVKVLPDLSRDSIRQVTERIGLKPGEILYVKSPGSWGKNSVHDLAEAEIGSIIIGEKTSGPLSDELRALFFTENLPLVTRKNVEVQVRGDFGSCDPDQLEEAIQVWQDELEEFRTEKSEEMITGLFKEYQAERERQVRKNG